MQHDLFPFEVNFFKDEKIKLLVRHQGGKSICTYIFALCSIYRSGYYVGVTENWLAEIAEASGYSLAYVKNVIACSLRIGLFSQSLYEKHAILTSRGIQKRYGILCKRKGVIDKIDQYAVVDDQPLIPEPVIKNGLVKKERAKRAKANPSREQVKEYVAEHFTDPRTIERVSRTSYDYYSAGDWTDSKGSDVINWKQKIRINFIEKELEKQVGSTEKEIKKVSSIFKF
jgi:hypothetical protein